MVFLVLSCVANAVAQVPSSATKPASPALAKAAPAIERAPAPGRAIVDRNQEIRKTLEMRKSRATLKARSKAAARVEAAKREERQREIELKTEAQRQEADRLAIEARKSEALDRLGSAAEQDAATNRARLGLQTQQAGVPQIFVPGQGMVPYSGGIASPYPGIYPGIPYYPISPVAPR